MSTKRVPFPTTRRSTIMLKLFRHTYHGIHFGRNAESCYMQWRVMEKRQIEITTTRPYDFFRTRQMYFSERSAAHANRKTATLF